MLQQTRVETAIPFYCRFLERFPRIEDLAGADLDEVLTLWSGLGYYRRARSLHEGAKIVLERHGGRFPLAVEEALEVPGVGPYTAGAILSIAHNLPEPVVDGNVERVLTRLFQISGNPKTGPIAKMLRGIARESIPKGRAADFNQALMELGATVCTALQPGCGKCPLAAICLAREHSVVDRYPTPAPRPVTVNVSLHAAVVRNQDEYLIERVTQGPCLRGLWLFPLARGEAEANKPSVSLLERLRQCLGVSPRFTGPLGRVRHSITFRRIQIEIFCFELRGSKGKSSSEHLKWARLDLLGKSVPVSSVALKMARLLEVR